MQRFAVQYVFYKYVLNYHTIIIHFLQPYIHRYTHCPLYSIAFHKVWFNISGMVVTIGMAQASCPRYLYDLCTSNWIPLHWGLLLMTDML